MVQFHVPTTANGPCVLASKLGYPIKNIEMEKIENYGMVGDEVRMNNKTKWD